MEQYGVKETKEAITLLARLAGAGDAAMADGKLDLTDLSQLIALVPVASPGIEGIGGVMDELGELSLEERKELEAHTDLEFGEGQYQAIGEEILQAAISIARVFTLFNKEDATEGEAETQA